MQVLQADTAPGTGPDQKPVQATDNQGPSEDENADEVSGVIGHKPHYQQNDKSK
jgi:hypothetical protein